MSAPLVDRFTGDIIPASDHNDVKAYIEDGTYRVNTLSLNIGGDEVINSSGEWVGPDIVSVTDSSTIDFTLTGQEITADVIESGISHANISDLNWSDAGHTIDTNLDINNNSLINVNSIDFNTSYTITGSEDVGSMYWNSDEQTVDVVLNDNVIQSLNSEIPVLCKNQTGSTITNGTPVMFAGTVGASGRILITPAIADGTYKSAYIVGVATEDIANGEDGFVAWFGKVRHIQTDGVNYSETWSNGDVIYVSPTTAGYMTNVMPSAPNQIISVGTVILADSSNGTIFVRPTWHCGLTELYDINGTATDTNGQLLVWDNDNSYFDFTKNINDYVPYTLLETTNDPTGFVNPEDVTVTGNPTNRTVTLSGTFEAYYNGKLNSTITDGWTSPAHADTQTTQFFLMYDGADISWHDVSTLEDDFFKNLLIAWAFYNGTNWVYQRECHGIMHWSSHRELHQTIGTYKESGGTIDDYTLNSTTASDRQPSVTASLIYDEDLPTTNASLSSGAYTQFYLSGTDASINFNLDATNIVPLNGTNPYYNEWTGTTWQQTLLPNGDFMSVWLLAVPMASDSDSQKLRYVWIQGQSYSDNLDDEKANTSNDLTTGAISDLTPESVFLGRVIIRYIGGDWQLVYVESLSGNRLSQVGAVQGNYLSSVATDSTLTGLGTTSSLLGIDLSNANTWTGIQTFSNGIVGDVTGNADTATTLETARDINGVSFDGSANITLYNLYQPDGTNAFVYTDNSGTLHIDGDIVQEGDTYETHAEELFTANDQIITRDGATAGLSVGEISGLKVELYDGSNDLIFGTDSNGYFKVGESGSLQILTTREDSPTDGDFMQWDDANKRIISADITTSDITNINSPSPNGYEILYYDDVNEEWKDGSFSTVILAGDNLSWSGDRTIDLDSAIEITSVTLNSGATVNAINTGFVDNDTSLMTSQAIKEKIATDISGKVSKSGDTMTGTLNLVAGTTTVAPLKMSSGTNLTTPQAGVFEYDGTDLYFTVA